MWARGVLVLAVLAALVWAPPTTSAATNLLDRPEASPTSGTTSTTFRLRVSYEGRFPALRVEVTVADRTLTMSLVSGSTADGTWEASVQLPAGVWPVVFTAVAERGNSPTLTGPTLTVLAPSVASTPPPSDDASGNGSPGRDGSGDVPQSEQAGDDAAPGETAAPAPTDGEAPGGDASAGNASASPMAAEPMAPGPASSSSTSGGAGLKDGTAESGDGTPAEATSTDAADVPSAMTGERTVADDGLLDDALRMTPVWAAPLLVVGSVTVGLLVRRRRREAADVDTPAVAAETEALLERRALRRARVLMPEDPIVASMGLGESPPSNRRSERRRRRRRTPEKR